VSGIHEHVRESAHAANEPTPGHLVATDFDAEREYDAERFSARSVFRSDRMKAVLGYFEPGQFIPVYAPDSDVAITIRCGTGPVRDGERDRSVEPGEVVVVPAGEDRGVKADYESEVDGDARLEATLVTAPPPPDGEHDPVREGLKKGRFDPGASE
jgi:quercetin dioxygenase-like cupin family protein